jgi:glycoprotein-N-acetylgalactosamine 3-beta-galactosyltransferase
MIITRVNKNLCVIVFFLLIVNFIYENREIFRSDLSHAKRPVRIFCFVLTSPKTLPTRAELVYDAWANECDGLKFITTIPVNSTRSKIKKFKRVEFMYKNKIPILMPPRFRNENYSRLTDKIYHTIIDLYKNYANDYDWFLKADDDTFIFVDHLRQFLERHDPESPIYFGYNLKTWVSGGAGYVLSRASLKRLGKKLLTQRTSQFSYRRYSKKCRNTGVEDQDISNCLEKIGCIKGVSIDDCGRERFHT